MTGKAVPRLIAIDLDGTLLSSSYDLSEENTYAIKQALMEGLQIVLASGRPLFGMQPYLDKLGLDGSVIAYNGALVIDAQSKRVQIDRPIAKPDVHSLIQNIQELHLYVSYYTGMTWYVEKECDEMFWELSAQKQQPIITNLSRDSIPLPHKMLVADLNNTDSLSLGYEIISKALPNLNIRFSGPYSFEITHAAASKGAALTYIAKEMGVPAEATVAIGDNFNDIDMFSFAGTSVAMGNSPAGVKASADWVVASNDEHGVAEAIHRLLNNKA
jgi:hypothetical protein